MRDGTILRADVWRADDHAPASRPAPALAVRQVARSGQHRRRGPRPAARGRARLRGRDPGLPRPLRLRRGVQPFRHEAADGVRHDRVVRGPALVERHGRDVRRLLRRRDAVARRGGGPPRSGRSRPYVTASEYYEGWTYQGGAFQLGFSLYWSSLRSRSPRPALARSRRRALHDEIAELLAEPWTHIDRLCRSADLGGIEELDPVLTRVARRTTGPRRRSGARSAPEEHYGAVDVPALNIGGWYDIFVEGTMRQLPPAAVRGGHRGRAAGQQLVMGPWSHCDASGTSSATPVRDRLRAGIQRPDRAPPRLVRRG